MRAERPTPEAVRERLLAERPEAIAAVAGKQREHFVARSPRPKKAPTPTPVAPVAAMAEGRARAAALGKHLGPTPFGYRTVRTVVGRKIDARLELLAGQAEVVRTIFREYLRLRSLRKLAAHLTALGLKSPRGADWSNAGLAFILGNAVYAGRVRFGKTDVRGLHEPIVSPVLYNQVQALRRRLDKKSPGCSCREVAP